MDVLTYQLYYVKIISIKLLMYHQLHVFIYYLY
jgi:hypothetical protein